MRLKLSMCFAVLLLAAGLGVSGCKKEGEISREPLPGGVPPEVCVPTTCLAAGKNCGEISDGCGGTLDCGTCTPPATCGGSGVPNVCGAVAPCVPTTCLAQEKNCGTIPDGCGGVLNCGTCTAPFTCGGGGTPKVCGGPGCVLTTCLAQEKNCGTIPDGCGGVLNCGTCTAPLTCGGGGTPNVCGAGEPPPGPVTCYKYAFVSNRDGAGNLYLGNTCEDGAPTKLTNSRGGETVRYPSFSPDGTRIAFGLSGVGPLGSGLRILNLRDDPPTTEYLRADDSVFPFGSPDYYPFGSLSWKGDGSEIVFLANSLKPVIMHDPTASDPYNPSDTVKILDNLDGTLRFEKVEWSPTTNPADESFNHFIFVKKDGDGPFVIDDYDFDFVDGRGVRTGGAREVWFYEPATSTLYTRYEGREPTFKKPDGSKIAFVRGTVDKEQIFTCEMDFDYITRTGRKVPWCTVSRDPLTTQGNNTSPNWSPDGQYIFFTSDRDGNKEIYKMKSDGTEQTRLTNSPGVDEMPAVSPISYTR